MGHIFLLSSINHKYNIIKRNVTLITNSPYLFNLSVLLRVYFHQQNPMFNFSMLIYFYKQGSFSSTSPMFNLSVFLFSATTYI